MEGNFGVFITPAAERLLKKLPREVGIFVRTEFPPLVSINPFIGELLSSPLDLLRSFHFSRSGQPYRIAYGVEIPKERIIVYLAWHRGGFYERLRRLLRK